jgi:hypothetical protein
MLLGTVAGKNTAILLDRGRQIYFSVGELPTSAIEYRSPDNSRFRIRPASRGYFGVFALASGHNTH